MVFYKENGDRSVLGCIGARHMSLFTTGGAFSSVSFSCFYCYLFLALHSSSFIPCGLGLLCSLFLLSFSLVDSSTREVIIITA